MHIRVNFSIIISPFTCATFHNPNISLKYFAFVAVFVTVYAPFLKYNANVQNDCIKYSS